jgi:hypothetical protein
LDSERNALLEIVRIFFTDDYSTAFDVNKILLPAWMDFEPSSLPTLPALPVRMFLLLETEMYRYYGISHMVDSCLQQLLRQDIGIWAVSSLRMNNYRLVALPTQSDPTYGSTLVREQIRIPMPVSPLDRYVLWPGLNIHFVPGEFCRWSALTEAKIRGGYFGVLPDNKVKDNVRIHQRQRTNQDAHLRNPISQALIGDIDWENDLVREYIRCLFHAANNDSKSMEAFTVWLLQPSVDVAAETSWLNVLTDHIMQDDKEKSFLSVAVLSGNTTCLPDEVIQQFREYATVFLIP